MTLQFPRYSKGGEKLEEANFIKYPHRQGEYLAEALKERYKPVLRNLPPDEIVALAALVGASKGILCASDSVEQGWMQSIQAITGDLWSPKLRWEAIEEYVAKLYPLLEPPTIGEEQ